MQQTSEAAERKFSNDMAREISRRIEMDLESAMWLVDFIDERFAIQLARKGQCIAGLLEACRVMRREYGAFGSLSWETVMQAERAIAEAGASR